MDNNLFTVFCICYICATCYTLPHLKRNFCRFLFFRLFLVGFACVFVVVGKWPIFALFSQQKKNYQNIHLDHKGLSWKNKRCILLRMKYSIWYRQFNGISFGFGLELLFRTKINICTGIMRIIQLQIYSSLLCRHIPHVQATYPIPLLFWAWFSQLLLSSFFLFWRLWRLAQECGVHRNS